MTLSGQPVCRPRCRRYWRRLPAPARRADADARSAIGRSSSGPVRSASRWRRCPAATSRRSCWRGGCSRSRRSSSSTSRPRVDVNARAEIYELVSQAVAQGCSVLLVTSDFEELARASDRVIVLAHGTVVADVRPPNLDAARLTQLAYSSREMAS